MEKIVPIGFVNRTCAVCGSKLYEINNNDRYVEIALPYAKGYHCNKFNTDYYIASYIADGKIYHYASNIDRQTMMLDNFYNITKGGYRDVSFGGWSYAVSLY